MSLGEHSWGSRVELGSQRELAERAWLDVRVGRCRALAPDCTLAFAMLLHPRLGLASPFCGLLTDLARRIVEHARSWLPDGKGHNEALLRLVGGPLGKDKIHGAQC